MTKKEAYRFVSSELESRGLFSLHEALMKLSSLVAVDSWKSIIEDAGCQWQERGGYEGVEPILVAFEGNVQRFKYWVDAAIWAEERARNKKVWSKPPIDWSDDDMKQVCEALGYTESSGSRCPDFLAGYAAALGRWDGGTSRVLLSGGDESANSQ